MTYTFDKREGNEQPGYTMVTRDAISGIEITHTGTYVIGTRQDNGRTFITMFYDEVDYAVEFQVFKLTSRDMKWKELTDNGWSDIKMFVKVTD